VANFAGGYFSSSYERSLTNIRLAGGYIMFFSGNINGPGLGTVRVDGATDTGNNPIQYYTCALTLGATVDAQQAFSSLSASIVGSENTYFGFAVTMPSSTSPLYGWLELDGTGSTDGYETVTATWAYDTTGAPIAVGAVPEPSTYALFGLGALALIVVYRHKVA